MHDFRNIRAIQNSRVLIANRSGVVPVELCEDTDDYNSTMRHIPVRERAGIRAIYDTPPSIVAKTYLSRTGMGCSMIYQRVTTRLMPPLADEGAPGGVIFWA